jgi:hypothetical protein
MSYSNYHRSLASSLQNPEALKNPQIFLGPNFQAVLDFWMRLDDITEDECKEFTNLYGNIMILAWEATCELIADIKNPTHLPKFTNFFSHKKPTTTPTPSTISVIKTKESK